MTTDGQNNTPVTPPAAAAAPAPTPAADPAPGAPDPAPGAPVTLESLLASGETVKVEELKPLLEREQQATIARIEQDIRERAQAEALRKQALDEQNAAALSDIEWAQTIYDQLDSPDPAVAESAKVAMRANEPRFNRGRAMKYERESSAAKGAAVSEYMGPIWDGVKAAGYADLFNAGGALHDGQSQAMRDANGNWMVAAMKSAEAIGYERGKNESANAAELNGRVVDASSGAPTLRPPAADSNSDLWDGIDRSQPGAAAKYQQRLAERQAKTIPGR